MLGELDAGACEQLCASVREVTLEPGETLFEPGDAEDAMYVVRGGLLELVLVERTPVRAHPSAHAHAHDAEHELAFSSALGLGVGPAASLATSTHEHVINRVGPGAPIPLDLQYSTLIIDPHTSYTYSMLSSPLLSRISFPLHCSLHYEYECLLLLTLASAGGAIHSLMSAVGAMFPRRASSSGGGQLSGRQEKEEVPEQLFTNLCARALERSAVLVLPFDALRRALAIDEQQQQQQSSESLETLRRLVSVLVTRLYRVTFLALYRYLALSEQLLDTVRSGRCPPFRSLRPPFRRARARARPRARAHARARARARHTHRSSTSICYMD